MTTPINVTLPPSDDRAQAKRWTQSKSTTIEVTDDHVRIIGTINWGNGEQNYLELDVIQAIGSSKFILREKVLQDTRESRWSPLVVGIPTLNTERAVRALANATRCLRVAPPHRRYACLLRQGRSLQFIQDLMATRIVSAVLREEHSAVY